MEQARDQLLEDAVQKVGSDQQPRTSIQKYTPNLRLVFEDAKNIEKNIPTHEEFWKATYFKIGSKFVSANPLQSERFNQDEVYIQKSNALTELLNEKHLNSLLKHSETYITGPAGMGKSYAILYFVLMQRKKAEMRILYINNPSVLLIDWFAYMVNEVIYAISEDLSSDLSLSDIGKEVFNLKSTSEQPIDVRDSIIKLFIKILENRDNEAIVETLRKLHGYYAKKEIPFLVIIDQSTKYQELGPKFPIANNHMEKILFYFQRRIYGRSTREPISSSMRGNELILGSKFNRDQTIIYLINKLNNESLFYSKLINDCIPNASQSQILDKIQEVTEFIPYELEVITRLVAEFLKYDVAQILDEYYSQRIPVIQEIHTKWLSGLPPTELKEVNQLIFLLDNPHLCTEGSFQDLPVKPNPNLTSYDAATHKWNYISDVVRQAIFRMHSRTQKYIEYVSHNLSKSIREFVNIIRKGDMPSRGIGCIFEKFIEYTIRIAAQLKENYCINYYSGSDETDIQIELPLKDARIEVFKSEALEAKISSFLEKPEIGILIPINPNFPFVDFIIIDPRDQKKRLIYLLQVTINIKDHKASDNQYYDELKELKKNPNAKSEIISKSIFSITQKHDNNVEIKFIWIGGDDLNSAQTIKPIDLLYGKASSSGIALSKLSSSIKKYL